MGRRVTREYDTDSTTGVAKLPLRNGVVLIGGDGHYWPGQRPPTAHRAMVDFCRRLKPDAIIFNGDALDAPSISRHPPIGWEDLPALSDEITEVQARLGELEQATKGARLFWPLGNHDARFNTRLAAVTPEFRGVRGTRLLHHFPAWQPCWAVEVGGEKGAVVKHRFKGGSNAPGANALWSGRTMVTGHLHSQKVTPITDLNGTRWGVDTGCLAGLGGKQFNYTEANPADHRSGFAVLTWSGGRLLPPELATVWNERKGLITFRGEVIGV